MNTKSLTEAFNLKGKHALITGGATGIGYAIAQSLSACGASITLVGRRERELLEATKNLGTKADFYTFDVNRADQASDLIHTIVEKNGSLDILVNNAGIHLKKNAVDLNEQEFQEVLDVHILGAAALSRHAAKSMIKGQGGSIIFIASMASLFGIPQLLAYSAAKSAMLGMVRTLSVEWGTYGIRVNAIAPGWISTDMMRKALTQDPERENKILSRTPLRQFGETADIGWAAAYLCSPSAKFVTGVCLPVDGGVSIGF